MPKASKPRAERIARSGLDRGAERRPDRYWLAWAAALMLLTFLAYLPATRAEFIWDDDAYVTDNATLRSAEGLGRIWFDLGSTIQYYPLVFTSFWCEHQLWGQTPTGYHIVNIALHGLAAILLWRVLLRLGVPGAGLAAAIFAVHPVGVESVAWVTERKNVLSMVFYLLAIGAYARFANLGTVGLAADSRPVAARRLDYAKSLACFVCALLSKTATVALPVVLLILTWWKRGKVRASEALATVPFFGASLVAGGVTSWVEKHHVGAGEVDWSLDWPQRIVLAGRSLCFYLGKLFWPTDLAFIYDRWEVRAAWPQFLYPLCIVGILLLLWLMAHRIGRGSLAAMLFFIVSLAPALGFVPFYFMTYSWVADHFQYLAGIGPITLAAAVMARGANRINPGRAKWLIACAMVLVVTMLAPLTFARARVFQNQETIWNDVLAKSPSARQQAHDNLAVYYNRLGRTEEEVYQYMESIKANPNVAEARSNLGIALHRLHRVDEGITQLREALRLRPDYAEAACNLGLLLAEKRQFAEAQEMYRRALKLKPAFAEAHFNLARLLASTGRIAEAITHYREVLAINPSDAEAAAELRHLMSQPPGKS